MHLAAGSVPVAPAPTIATWSDPGAPAVPASALGGWR
jgi:hypothetical protein